MRYDSPQRNDWHSAERYVPALVLIAIGAIFLLNNLHIFSIREFLSFWPVVLIVAGVFKLVDSETEQGRVAGGVLTVVGGIFMASNLGLLPVRVWALWPLILIGLGVVMLINRFPMDFGYKPAPSRESDGMAGTFSTSAKGSGHHHDFAIFGGGKRTINSDNFERATFEAVCGGFEIDLRSAVIAGPSAVIEVNAIFGGAEIKIPVNWSAVVRGVGVFGAFSDSTTQPSPSMFPNPKILYVKGSALFGGVNVKN